MAAVIPTRCHRDVTACKYTKSADGKASTGKTETKADSMYWQWLKRSSKFPSPSALPTFFLIHQQLNFSNRSSVVHCCPLNAARRQFFSGSYSHATPRRRTRGHHRLATRGCTLSRSRWCPNGQAWLILQGVEPRAKAGSRRDCGAGSESSRFGFQLFGDVPRFAMGTTYVPRTGLAMVHQGEAYIIRGWGTEPGNNWRRHHGANHGKHRGQQPGRVCRRTRALPLDESGWCPRADTESVKAQAARGVLTAQPGIDLSGPEARNRLSAFHFPVVWPRLSPALLNDALFEQREDNRSVIFAK